MTNLEISSNLSYGQTGFIGSDGVLHLRLIKALSADSHACIREQASDSLLTESPVTCDLNE